MNVRPSNTEPLLRLNVEGDTQGADGAAPGRSARHHPRVSDRQPRALRVGARRRCRRCSTNCSTTLAIRSRAGTVRRTTCANLRATAERLRTGRFVLAVVGEFSSGKSFLLNALLGKIAREERAGTARITGLLATDINPSTATITELSYADEETATAHYRERPHRTHSDRRTRALRRRRRCEGKLHDATDDEGDAPALRARRRQFAVSGQRLRRRRHAGPRIDQPGPSPRDAVVLARRGRRALPDRHAAAVHRRRRVVSRHHPALHREHVHRADEDRSVAHDRSASGREGWQAAAARIVAQAAVHAPGYAGLPALGARVRRRPADRQRAS